jgi:uncharacterized membrane protein
MNDAQPTDADFGQMVDPALITLTKIIYLLQALGYVTGLSYIAAVIINYVKIDEVQGTWLESHFRWQIRTFWYSLLWYFLGGLLLFIGIGYLLIVFTTFWVLYRIIKGWLRVMDHKGMYN